MILLFFFFWEIEKDAFSKIASNSYDPSLSLPNQPSPVCPNEPYVVCPTKRSLVSLVFLEQSKDLEVT